jgi:hypothetical protein
MCFTVTQALFHCASLLAYTETDAAYFSTCNWENWKVVLIYILTFMNEKCVLSLSVLSSFSSVAHKTTTKYIFHFTVFHPSLLVIVIEYVHSL